MSERILVGTRKGTFFVERSNGAWSARLAGHHGAGVNYVARDPNTGTITLFGETINWLNIEDIQADGSTLESYESLFAGTGLGGYGSALDNLSGLNDPLREFFKALNDVALSDLSDAASYSSGQTLRNAMADLRRERDTNFNHLFSNQFSSLRGEV